MNNQIRIKKLLFLLPAVSWMVLITYLSSRNELPDMQELFRHADKIAHFIVYFVLGMLLILGLIINTRKNDTYRIIIILFIGSLFAFIDEYHQSFVPNRVPDMLDLIADILGIIFSLIFYKHLKIMIKKFLLKISFKLNF